MQDGKEYILKNGRPGDVIACAGNWAVSDAINLATFGIPRWGISHVGILCDYKDRMLMFQSLAFPTADCFIQGKKVKGAQAQPIEDCLGQDGSKVWHYPLCRDLYNHELTRLRAGLLEDIGKAYDTLGALEAGGRVWSIVFSYFRRQHRAALFCSDWVAETLCDIGIFDTGDYAKWSPNRLIRRGNLAGIFKPPVRIA